MYESQSELSFYLYLLLGLPSVRSVFPRGLGDVYFCRVDRGRAIGMRRAESEGFGGLRVRFGARRRVFQLFRFLQQQLHGKVLGRWEGVTGDVSGL